MEKRITDYSANEKVIFTVLETAILKRLQEKGSEINEILPSQKLVNLGLGCLDIENIFEQISKRCETRIEYMDLKGCEYEDMNYLVQYLEKEVKLRKKIKISKIAGEEKERLMFYMKIKF